MIIVKLRRASHAFPSKLMVKIMNGALKKKERCKRRKEREGEKEDYVNKYYLKQQHHDVIFFTE